MKQRVAALVGPVAEQDVGVDVPLGLCAHPAPRRRARSGYPSAFTIYDQADAVRLTGYVLRDLNLDSKRFPPRSVHAAISAAKNEDVAPGCVRRSGVHHLRARRSPTSTTSTRPACRKAGAMDFDDLLHASRSSCSRHRPDVLEHYQRRFGHVLVDEYQDTNAVQNELVLLPGRTAPQRLRRRRRRPVDLPVPRAPTSATSSSSRRPSPTPRVVVLEQNYRSTQTILDAANAVIANNTGRKPKELWTDAGPRASRSSATTPTTRPTRPSGWRQELARLHDGERPPVGRHGGLLPHQRPEPRARGAPHAGRHPVQGHRRHPVLRPPRDQGRAGLPAGGRQPDRRGQSSSECSTRPSAASATRRSPSSMPGRPPRGLHLHRRAPPRRRRRGLRSGQSRASTAFLELIDRAGRDWSSWARPPCSRRCSSAVGYLAELEAERSHRGRGSAREPGRARRRCAREFDDGRRVPRAGQPGGRHRRARRRRDPRSC